MMTRFDGLIALIELLKMDEYGEWIIDIEHKSTEDRNKVCKAGRS